MLQLDGQRHVAVDSAPAFRNQRYWPRIEGLFARIERWMELATGDVNWRSISEDNIFSIYGGSAVSRIAETQDRSRIFTWLIIETLDNRDNAIHYRYKTGGDKGLTSRWLTSAAGAD